MPRNFIGGIIEGVNFTVTKGNNNRPFSINVDKCNDMIVVDRQYFLKNLGLIRSWALHFEKRRPTQLLESKVRDS
jgi:hypothetical protein